MKQRTVYKLITLLLLVAFIFAGCDAAKVSVTDGFFQRWEEGTCVYTVSLPEVSGKSVLTDQLADWVKTQVDETEVGSEIFPESPDSARSAFYRIWYDVYEKEQIGALYLFFEGRQTDDFYKELRVCYYDKKQECLISETEFLAKLQMDKTAIVSEFQKQYPEGVSLKEENGGPVIPFYLSEDGQVNFYVVQILEAKEQTLNELEKRSPGTPLAVLEEMLFEINSRIRLGEKIRFKQAEPVFREQTDGLVKEVYRLEVERLTGKRWESDASEGTRYFFLVSQEGKYSLVQKKTLKEEKTGEVFAAALTPQASGFALVSLKSREQYSLGDSWMGSLLSDGERAQSFQPWVEEGAYWENVKKPNLEATFYVSGEGKCLMSMETTDPQLATTKGIVCGSSKNDILQGYPETEELSPQMLEWKNEAELPYGRIRFYLENDKVSRISIYYLMD